MPIGIDDDVESDDDGPRVANAGTATADDDHPVRRRSSARCGQTGRRRGGGTVLAAPPQDAETGAPVRDGAGAGWLEEALALPESTHSFLFTEPVRSPAFWFGACIAAMSFFTLILCLINNAQSSQVPVNVGISVRAGQFVAYIMALMMEEEISTGLLLLRRVSWKELRAKCPHVSYRMFVASAVLRVVLGYLFLLNIVFILVRANTVIEIFYDVLALEFIQQLDDIGFSLCKRNVISTKLLRATLTPSFAKEFRREKKRINIVKVTYYLNILITMVLLTIIAIKQSNGSYQCKSITLQFGDEVWGNALVNWPEGSAIFNRLKTQNRTTLEDKPFIFSFFNGVYVKDGTNERRPVYVEQKKTDKESFDTGTYVVMPMMSLGFVPFEPAEIKYCGGRWIWTHKYILKSKKRSNEKDCPWLARSPKTDGYDLLKSDGLKWELWNGVIADTEVRISDNTCTDDDDCNLNGECNGSNGKCECDEDTFVRYLGEHCEIKVSNQCHEIVGEVDGSTWSIGLGSNPLYQIFNRPVYTYVKGTSASGRIDNELGENDAYAMMYSGLRWYGILLPRFLSADDSAVEFWQWSSSNYHPFWADIQQYSTQVSEPTKLDSPVGVDFFRIEGGPTYVNGEILRYGVQNDQFGPFGSLLSMQKNNQTGRGLYKCVRTLCSFCPEGISNPTMVVPGSNGQTCGSIARAASALLADSDTCQAMQPAKPLCCDRAEGNLIRGV